MIDIDIITGFLGAGKTTFANLLLNYYLSKNERAVYIVNEFGQTAMDAELIKKEGFEAVALSNGCICCTLKNGLLISMREIVHSFGPTKIVFETSGIFIFDQFKDILHDEFLKSKCRINSAITIIDSINYKKGMLLAGSFISNQVKNSSVLVVSKLERFKGDLNALAADLKEANPNAAVITGPWDGDEFIETVLKNNGNAEISHPGHTHEQVDSLTLRQERDYSAEEFRKRKEKFLSGAYGKIFRVKGYIRIDGQMHLLNISLDDVVLKRAEEAVEPMLTFIGEGMDKRMLFRLMKD